jgi:hypothetical protein
MESRQTDIFGKEQRFAEDLLPEAESGNAPDAGADKDLYDGLSAKERWRRYKMDNDIKAKLLIYRKDADQAIADIEGTLVGAFGNGVDTLPSRLVGKSEGEIRQILEEFHIKNIEMADKLLAEKMEWNNG